MLGANLVELLEQGDLGVFVFDYGLDHKVGVPQIFEPGGGIDPAQNVVALFGLEAAALDHAVEIARNRFTSARNEILRNIVEQHLHSGLRRDLRNAGTHLARSNHPHCPNTHPRPPRKPGYRLIERLRPLFKQSSKCRPNPRRLRMITALSP